MLEWVVRGSHSGRCRARAPTRVRIAHGGGKITTNKAVALRNYYLRMLRSGEILTELQRKAAADAGLDLAAMQAEVQPGGKESMKEALRRQLKEAEAKHALLLQAAAAKGAPCTVDSDTEAPVADAPGIVGSAVGDGSATPCCALARASCLSSWSGSKDRPEPAAYT